MRPLLHRRLLAALAALAAALFLVPSLGHAQDREPGLTVRLYALEVDPEGVPELAPYQSANADAVSPTAEVEPALLRDAEGGGGTLAVVRGFLRVDEPGRYEFEVDASGPARAMIVNGWTIEAGATTGGRELKAGTHRLLVEAGLPGGDDRRVDLRWKPPGAGVFQTIPADLLTTDADITRLTAPGFKTIKRDLRPGDRSQVSGVHPGWDLLTLHTEDGFNPMVGSMAFLPDGRLVVGTMVPLQRSDSALPDIESKEPDKLWAFSGTGGDSAEGVTVEPIADGLAEPMGLCWYEGALYVAQRKEITKLTDSTGDGFLDRHETVASGWEGWNYHQFTFGLVQRGGKLYSALSTAMSPPKWEGMRANAAPNGPFRGSLIEVDLNDGNAVRYAAGGFRTPNGLGLGPDDDLYYSDNQGTWVPASLLSKVEDGRFYGHMNNDNFVPNLETWLPDGGRPSLFAGEPRAATTVWLPHNEVSNSPTTPLLVKDGLYAGQMLVGELTAGGVRRVFLEEVNGTTQGAVFRFTQGLESGVNRMLWGPDGGLYLGGIGAGGNWAWNGTKRGLQRLKPNGKIVFEMKAVRATPDGFEIEYTKPVDAAFLGDPANFRLRQWRYEPAPGYGGPKIDDRELEVTAAEPDDSGTRVRLTVPGAETGHVVHVVADPKSTDGEAIWSTEAWYTLNVKPIPDAPERVTIAGREHEAGPIGLLASPPVGAVVVLGRGHLAGWQRGGEKQPAKNFSQDDFADLPGEAEMTTGLGDLRTRSVHGDARLHVEWLSPPGGVGQLAGNSGVYLQDQYELQVMNTAADAEPMNNEAASIYNVKAPDVNASNGAGAWQSYDVWFRAARFEGEEKVENARITVLWNGRLVHDDVELTGPTGAASKTPEVPGPAGVTVGPLRLQDHATAAEGPVRFRNVWVAPLDEPAFAAGPWESLFDGETLDGWKPAGGEATYAVEDGVIVGATRPDTPNTFLTTERRFGDFELELEARVDPALNSGVQFRSRADSDARDARVRGPQYELDSSDRAWSGGIYGEGGRGWIAPLSANPAARAAFERGEWNRLRIRAAGDRVQTWINEVPAAVLMDAGAVEGLIGLQVHGVGDNAEPMEARWRNLRIRKLTPTVP